MSDESVMDPESSRSNSPDVSESPEPSPRGPSEGQGLGSEGTESPVQGASGSEGRNGPEDDDEKIQEPPPEETLPPVNFDVDKQEATTIYNVGVMMGAAEKPLFEEVPITVIEQVKKLFVAPPAYPQTIPSGRTILVSGPPHSGKFFCSVKLAITLQGLQASGEPARLLLIYSRLRHETAPLVQSISSLKAGSILILEDVFEKNVSEREVVSIELARLNNALQARRSFLILTTVIEEVKTEALIVSTKEFNLKNVFERHRDYYLPEGNQIYKAIADLIHRREATLISFFASPFQIEHFFQKILTRSPRSEKEVLKIAQEAAQTGRQDLRGWFEGLPQHVKLVGLLACLLEGIEKVIVEEVFVDSVTMLREQGFVWIADLRELGLKEAWTLLKTASDVSYVHFDNKYIREELEWQVENRQILLWSVMQHVATSAPEKRFWREDVRARAALGAAVGWLGIWDKTRFRAIQELWANARDFLAKEPDNTLGSLPGYAFVERLLSDPAHGRRRVLAILADWIASRNPDLMWAAGAAIWRLYQTAASMTDLEISQDEQTSLRDELVTRLHTLLASSLSLSKTTKARVRAYVGKEREREKEGEVKRKLWDGASFALKKIGEVDAQRFASTLTAWFGEGSQIFSLAASRSAQFTFLDLAERKDSANTLDFEARLKPIDIILLNKSAESRVVEAMFHWLGQWLLLPAWDSAIRQHLLGIANQGPRALRTALRSALARYWLSLATEGIPGVARALIARSYAMEGVLTESPALGRCLLIIDPELILGRAPRKTQDREAQQQAERREGAILQILAMVEARMAVTILLLGAQEASERANRGLRLTADLPLHRLMRPGVQNVAPNSVRMVLLLTAGPVIDLEDGLDSVSAEHKLVIAANCELEVPLGTEVLPVGRDLSARDLETVEAKLRLICARAQAALDPAGWEPLLERLGVSIADLDAAPKATLAAWAVQLDQLDKFYGDTGRPDPAKKILCALHRLAAADLDACLRIVRTWLTGGTDLERPMAAATAVALLRAVTDAPGIWGGLAPQRTFDELAGALARSGKDGTDAMLATVKRWLTEPALAEVLAGAVEDGRCRLLRWAEEAAPQQVAAFQEALKPLRKSLEDAELGPSGEVLDAVFDRLRVRLAMGRPRPLPALAAGERFGVIVIDASARWGQLAADLFSRFNEPPTSLKPLLYRLGERWPSWVAGDPNPKPADLSPVGVRLPRLIGPILNELSPAAVSFLVVLSGEMWIDGEDWIDSPWRERIFTFRQLPDAPFRPVLAAFPHRPDQEKEEVDLMEFYLKKQRAGGAEEAA